MDDELDLNDAVEQPDTELPDSTDLDAAADGTDPDDERSDRPDEVDDAAHGAELHDVRFGYSYTVPGETDSGNSVAWSTSTNTFHDEKTWEAVEPS